jgi:alpha-L-rhamnosidase
MENNSHNYLWNTGFHFGDWLFYDADDDRMGISAITDRYLIAQCFAVHSTRILLDAARILGKKPDEARYAELLSKFREAFIQEYVTPNGRLVSGTQTAYTLALHFDMLPEHLRTQAARKLADNVRSYRYHLTTGFLGTPYLCHVLTRFGYPDVAYKLLLQETYPSWLYPVKMGATTIWERWDGIKPDSTFQTPTMNSFNHYAYGAIGDWMYRTITGLDTDSQTPGYKKINIRPYPGGGLSYARADLLTPYGPAASHWETKNGLLVMDVEIPANTTAQIYIPASGAADITLDGKTLTSQPDIRVLPEKEGDRVVIQTGSGHFRFVTKYRG